MTETVTIVLPDIGEGVVEGEVVKWLKAEGDRLEQDEPVVTVMTDKATVDLPATYPGVLAKQHYGVGEIAIKDQPLYDITIDSAFEGVIQRWEKKREGQAPKEKKAPEQKVLFQGGKALATPKVRGLARQLGKDLSAVSPTGPYGNVTIQDLGGFSTQLPKPVPRLDGDREIPFVGRRRRIAEKMVESKRNIPHFAFFDRADATRLIQIRENSKEEAAKAGIKLTYLPFFLRALALCIQEHPHVNASLDLASGCIVQHEQVNIGIASKTADGVTVPVLKNVQSMSFHEVIQNFDQLRLKTVAGELSREDLSGGTITVSNFGTEGGRWATPVINAPEAAILGIARIEDEVLVRNGKIVARPMVRLSWSFDHRLFDGAEGAAFSCAFVHLIENPGQLL